LDFDHAEATRLAATLERNDAAGNEEDDGPVIEQSDNSLVRLINSMILEAQSQGVSDIHVECPPGREKVRVRFRKDGVLRPYLELPPGYRNAMVARIKIMCDLDISERRKPQDGKINFGKFVNGSRLELRVATIPTSANHEDAVLRLLASSRAIPLAQLHLSASNLERFKAAVLRPYGMILCVGPTGSGKTTTLHSALAHINTPERKIWTAEDPVEITQPGLRQVQVNPRIDWTFAKALRAFLRADPDVIMVGEVRDHETAQVAIEASLTGHLVLSTLHTNSAAETVTRLLDMGMDPFNFADALLAVLAQRLVRRLCPDCRKEEAAPESWTRELLHDHQHVMRETENAPDDSAVLASWLERFGVDGRLRRFASVGCDACGGTGVRGRLGIHELLTVSRGLRHKIQTGQRSDDLLRHALGDGMRTLRQDGIEKVLSGLTSIEEVRANS
jgi:type II secretory ATPase GspE/PulE/Tfp pilus assembly ATPase PilB-like protein